MDDQALQLEFRFATVADAALLAQLNQLLIRDEGHRNRMTLAELEQRMRGWLDGVYGAVMFTTGECVAGYALYRHESDHVYLRQFFVTPDHRRRGVGRAAMAWLRENAWPGMSRVRIDVLVGNAAGIAFWRSVGFVDYCITMELRDDA